MKKTQSNDNVFYTIAWSRMYRYDKHDAGRVLPELSGILSLHEDGKGENKPFLLFYGCWREGLRLGLKNLLDPQFTRFPEIMQQLHGRKILYRYTVVDSSPADMRDVLYWLIQQYGPPLNNPVDFTDSQRYENIFVKEMDLQKDEVVERLPKTGL